MSDHFASNQQLTPIFSIGIPNFERPDYLKEALQNIFAQSFVHFEVIVSDDCSRTDIAAVVSQFKDPRLRWVRQEKNIGAIANFNYVINEACGRYIVLHQNDDLLHPDFLLRAYTAFQQAPYAKVYASCVWAGDPDQGLRASTLPHLGNAAEILAGGPFEIDGNAFATQLLVSLPITFPAVVIAAERWRAIGGYFSEYELGADQITLCRALIGTTLLYDSRIGGLYRAHLNQTSRSSGKRDKRLYHELTLKQMVSDLEQREIPWQQLSENFARQSTIPTLRGMLRESIIFRADSRLIRLLWGVLWQRQRTRGAGEIFKFGKQLKVRDLFYLLSCLFR